MKPFELPPLEVVKLFGTDSLTGLSVKNYKKQLTRYGRNIVPEKKRDSWFIIFIRQFMNPLIYILLFAALIIFFFGSDYYDAFVISAILLFNALIGTVQEGRARSILASLKKFTSVEAVVIRQGITIVVDAADLVPGDIVIMQEGQRVPADIRLLMANNLLVDEALMTGESSEVLKNAETILAPNTSLADQCTMVFKGTYILAGSGKGIVVATGLETEIGKIQQQAQDIQTDMPLKQELARLSRWILIGSFGICFFLFLIGLLTSKPFPELLVTLTALFICVVPEGLPVVLTLVLVTGVYRMAKRRVLVKRMQAVEALGRIDVIVTDKTGTLTRNEMMVSLLFAAGREWQVTGEGYKPVGGLMNNGSLVEKAEMPEDIRILAVGVQLLCNAQLSWLPQENVYAIKGDPTEAALGLFAQKIGILRDALNNEYKILYEIPFDSRLKYHAGFYQKGAEAVIFVTGAPETLLSWCGKNILREQEEMSTMLAQGLRVIAVGYKAIPLSQFEVKKAQSKDALSFLIRTELRMLGLLGIQDDIRSEVKEVVAQMRQAGLEVIMATGDHKKTALYVARNVGIFREGDEAINGDDFAQLSDAVLQRRIDRITVYSRVSPAYKLRIIQQFHAKRFIVAMTGDGVNDVPSLIAADIGIAMGCIGTEVARDAADIVLLDDSFVHVVTAIKEGRHIFYTIRRVVLYFFATNMGEILIISCAILISFLHSTFPLPLTAAQILWLNLITDGFLDTALSMEKQEKDLLIDPWFKVKRHLIDSRLIIDSLRMGIPMAIGSLLIYSYYHDGDLNYARTMTLLAMAMFQWFNAWNCRSERHSIMQLGIFSNRWLVLATLVVLCLQILLVYTPWLQQIFKTVPISWQDWMLIITISSSVIILEEARKWAKRLSVVKKV